MEDAVPQPLLLLHHNLTVFQLLACTILVILKLPETLLSTSCVSTVLQLTSMGEKIWRARVWETETNAPGTMSFFKYFSCLVTSLATWFTEPHDYLSVGEIPFYVRVVHLTNWLRCILIYVDIDKCLLSLDTRGFPYIINRETHFSVAEMEAFFRWYL